MRELLTFIQRGNESIDFKQQRSCSAIPVYFRCKSALILIEMTCGVMYRLFKGDLEWRGSIFGGVPNVKPLFILQHRVKETDGIFDCLYIKE